MRLLTRTLLPVVLVPFLLESPARALDSITLENGDVLTGEVVERTDEYVVLDHPQLGQLKIPVKETLTPDRDSGATQLVAESTMPVKQARTDEESEAPAKGGLFGTRILRGWDSSFGAGLSGSQGGLEDTKLNLSFKTKIENPRRLWDFDSAYFLNLTPRGEGDGDIADADITKDQGFAQLRRKWFFPDSQRWQRVFIVARTRYDQNQFQRWKHRIAASAGPGYFLLRNDKWELPANAGFGFSSTFWEQGDTAPEATAGFDVTWNPSSWSRLTTSNQFYWDLSNTSEYRTVQSMLYEIDPGSTGGVGFSFGFLYQHDTDSQGKENDLTYLASLTYGF